MRAVVTQAAGGVEMLTLADRPRPALAPDHVLVGVRTCGIAHRDVIERRRGGPGMVFPIVQGHEIAGEIIAVGADVTGWATGDRVITLYAASCGACATCRAGEPRACRAMRESYGYTVDGGYADVVQVHPSALVGLINGIDWPVAATLMSALGVGFHNVVHKARVRAGEHVLITGASGGVGLAALRTVKHLGAVAWAATSSPAKQPALIDAGADHVLVDDGTTLHRQLRAARLEGVDAVIDCVGSPTLNAGLRALRPYGRAVAIGNVDPAPLSLNVGLLVVGGIDLMGSDNVTRETLDELMPLVRDGAIGAAVDSVVPLSAVADAHRRIEAREVTGRIVLDLRI